MNTKTAFDAGAWFPDITGSFSNGGALTINGDLGVKKSAALSVNADFKFNQRSGLVLSYFSVKNTGTGTASAAVTYGGNTVNLGDTFNFTMNLSSLDLLWEYNFVTTDDGDFNLLLGIKYADASASIDKVASVGAPAFNDSFDKAAAVPVIGFSGKQRIADMLYGYAKIYGIGGGSGSNSATMIDARAGVRWAFQPDGWFLDGYWRTLGFRFSDANTTSKATFSGIGVAIRKEF